MSISYMGMGLFFFLVKMHHISKNRLYSSGHTASATPIATFYSYRHLSRKPLKTTSVLVTPRVCHYQHHR